MIDCHVAECYGKCTRDFNKQVERNRKYFRGDWCFQPTLEEWKFLKILINQGLTDEVAKCHLIKKTVEDSNVGNFSLACILGQAAKSHALPWFYSKKGIYMAAFFQSTPIARTRAIHDPQKMQEQKNSHFIESKT